MARLLEKIPGMGAHACNSSTARGQVSGALGFSGQIDLPLGEFQPRK